MSGPIDSLGHYQFVRYGAKLLTKSLDTEGDRQKRDAANTIGGKDKMCVRRITLPDGRYLIFYSFETVHSNNDRERMTEAAPAARK